MTRPAHRALAMKGRLALPVALALLAVGCGGGTSSSAPATTAASEAPATTAPSAALATTAPSAATSAPSAAASPSAAAGNVTAEVSQFKVVLSAATAPAGSVTFDVTNKGTVEHEFVVFKTDLAADKLPLSKDGTEVDEEGKGVTAVDEIGEFKPGTTKSLTVDLPAGHYVMICNVPTHYNQGMHAEFTTN